MSHNSIEPVHATLDPLLLGLWTGLGRHDAAQSLAETRACYTLVSRDLEAVMTVSPAAPANDDVEPEDFGTRLEVKLWWTRDREDRGRVRMRQGQSPVRPWERHGGKGNGIKARRRRKAG